MIISGWLLVGAFAFAVVVVGWLLVLGGLCWLVVGSCVVDSRWWLVLGSWMLLAVGCWFFVVVVDWLLILSGCLFVVALALAVVVDCLLLVLVGRCWLVVGWCLGDGCWWLLAVGS
jgi:hypothetical protein